jgi:hypothetical protein
LRCINLFEEYDRGSIAVDGEPIGYRVDERTGRRLRMPDPGRASGSAWCSRASTCSRT